jgi:hypothetical protein
MATIPSNFNFPKQTQVPEHSILDQFNKQTYLGNAFILPAPGITVTTTPTPIALIVNPASSSKSLFVNLRRYTSHSGQIIMRVYNNAVPATLGTQATPINLRAANSNTSVANCYLNGQFTLTSDGTITSTLGVPTGNYVIVDNTLLIILDPGQNLCVISTADTSSTLTESDISWYEL